MSEADFARTFRVPRAVFDIICAAAVAYVLCSGVGSLPTDMQVAIGLYKLARPISFYDLAQKFGISTSAAHFATTRFITFLIDTYGQAQLFDRWPTTADECVQYAAAMSARTGDPLRMLKNCIGALDGTLIPIWCKESMQRLYQCRKGFHAISIQAVCNGLGFFIWIGGARPGSTWDGNAIKNDTQEDTYKHTGTSYVRFNDTPRHPPHERTQTRVGSSSIQSEKEKEKEARVR